MEVFLFTLICLLLLGIYGTLIAWYQKAWTQAPVFTPATGANQPTAQTRISVLVPARNEEQNIGNCLASLSRQSYPRHLFEIIVIDDFSSDTTASIVRKEIGQGMDIRLISLADLDPAGIGTRAYKKFAIETGIHAATGSLIVTTDADCVFDPKWLGTIAAFYETTNARFIAAPVRIGQPGSGAGFLSIFQTLDFITLQGITAAAVHKKIHSMCNGANLAYEKKAFLEVDGFRGIDTIPSGDDMLLMHKIYRKYPGLVFFCKSREAIVSTTPESGWKGFFNQRIRWASKADSYDDKRIFRVLLLVYIINVMFMALALASFWNSWWLMVLLVLLVLKTMVEYPFVRSVARFFGQQGMMVYFPAMQPFHICYTVIIGWLGKFGSYRWKERKISK